MANNYVLFSEEITDLTDEEVEWLEQVLVQCHSSDWQVDYPELAELLGLSEEEAKKLEVYWPDFEFSIDDAFGNKYLTVWSDDNGRVDNVGLLYGAFLRRFRPEDVYWIQWAETCSKPLPGQFGGGAIRVSAEKILRWGTWCRDAELPELIELWREAAAEGDPMGGR
jgi:hypothetical protein